MGQFSRRSFLGRLGSLTGLGLFGRLFSPGRARAQPNAVRVVTITDGQAWRGPDWTNHDLDHQVLKKMTERALCELTGKPDSSQALASLIPDLADSNPRIGIKTNCVNPDLPTHPKLATVLADLLSSAGAIPENIIVFDRTDWELAACGYQINTGTGHQVYGSDHSGIGYDDNFVTVAEKGVKLSKILTQKIDHLINLPVLKNHEMAQVTLSLKNHFGSIDSPDRLHGTNRDCCPGIADLSALPQIRELTRLILIDALFGSYRSGLGAKPDFAPMSLVAATDPVSADTVGQEIINARRLKDNLPLLDAKHIHQAAARGLGTTSSIERIDKVINPVTEKPKPWQSSSSGCSSSSGSGTGLAAGLAGVAALAMSKKRNPHLPGLAAKRREKQPNQEG